MTKADKILIVFSLCIGITFFLLKSTTNASYADVYLKNERILTIDLNTEKKTYTVKGTLGKIVIEAGNGKIRVIEEKSSNHICSKQGWVSKKGDSIVCLPNEVVIQLSGKMELDTIVR
jgi:hypothetical protein